MQYNTVMWKWMPSNESECGYRLFKEEKIKSKKRK